ncbi:MAG: hypothetical protein EOO62_21500 [Hymenobacter sp.]|nr:MAG: hypothetical protein EOO62_21500 [Hymenobacter sp.]
MAAGLLPAPVPPAFRLDEVGGIGGLPFDQPAAPGVKLVSSFNGFGKRWRATVLYSRPGDTTQLGGLGPPDAYWFRANCFIGIDKILPSPNAIQRAYQVFTAQYGPARADTVPDSWYWLGQHSYVLLEKIDKKRGMFFVASLGMLNEQVHETAVRARARRLLGWHPDSLGLPRQYPNR